MTEEEYISLCQISVYNEYGLPCEHMLFQVYTLKKTPLITENDIPSIFLDNIKKLKVMKMKLEYYLSK